jgi:mannose-1-phosphate guanylyltransferase
MEKELAALILVGGFGTRLRPLTFTRSKPLVEFCNKPMVEYQCDALVDAGVTRIVFALSTIQEDFKKFMQEYEAKQKALNHNVKLIASIETIPMGTAGPISLAAQYLENTTFFMLNSDVISPYPFKELLIQHRKNVALGAEGTIMSWKVPDSSRFGVIIHEPNGKITGFLEKPKDYGAGDINAGHYILESSVIKRIPQKPTSIERVVFPEMVQDNTLYVMPFEGFWADIGTPESFISTLSTFIPRLVPNSTVLTGNNVKIGENAQIGPNVSIGDNTVIGNNCVLKNCVIMSNVKIGNDVQVEGSIIGWSNIIGNNVIINEMSVLGEDVTVADNTKVNGVLVSPHKSVNDASIEAAKKKTIIL